ncbi:hypothetical protein DFA_06039 [Cavenderia fasciculata]|uniref:Transmembrane protein n=1 Tax=Cavenderia fasciculata TaxID=261658 RepID=F4PJX7_CACFS|nr:uncharacterized protein DFA_06039 [Cavenderia fasciculata]EGG23901.1 hypothetical protein DFA_06039 [Cavenderia fasciculata]|eukprot:XP_004361752.1 hypothetical protein DFA_06039 [Cavenderia fasciculata]
MFISTHNKYYYQTTICLLVFVIITLASPQDIPPSLSPCNVNIDSRSTVLPGQPCGSSMSSNACPTFADAMAQCINNSTNITLTVYPDNYIGSSNTAAISLTPIPGFNGTRVLNIVNYLVRQSVGIDLSNTVASFIQASTDVEVYVQGVYFFNTAQDIKTFPGAIMSINSTSSNASFTMEEAFVNQITSTVPGALFYINASPSSTLSLITCVVGGIVGTSGAVVYGTDGLSVSIQASTFQNITSNGSGPGTLVYIRDSTISMSSLYIKLSTITESAIHIERSTATIESSNAFGIEQDYNYPDPVVYFFGGQSNVTISSGSLTTDISVIKIEGGSSVYMFNTMFTSCKCPYLVSVGNSTALLNATLMTMNNITSHSIIAENSSYVELDGASFFFSTPGPKQEGVLIYVEESRVVINQTNIQSYYNYSSYFACDEESNVTVDSGHSIMYLTAVYNTDYVAAESCTPHFFSCEIRGLEECEKEPFEWEPVDIVLVLIGCLAVVIISLAIFLKIYHQRHQYTQL